MKVIELSTATRPLAEYASEIGDEIVVLTAHEKPVAAIVSLAHLDREAVALSTSTEFMLTPLSGGLFTIPADVTPGIARSRSSVCREKAVRVASAP